MKTIKLTTVFLFVGLLVFGGVKFYDSIYFDQARESITVEFRYMQYACGDCYPQWNVQKVIGDGKADSKYKGRDMQVYFQQKELYDILKTNDQNCIICFQFIVKGKVEKTLSGKYRFLADEYKMIKNEECCNN
jgi:hypothetical protein